MPVFSDTIEEDGSFTKSNDSPIDSNTSPLLTARALDGICITGMGIFLPVARGCREVACALRDGQDAFGHVKSFDGSMLASDLVSEFNSFNIKLNLSDEELAYFDRSTWFAIAAVEEALAQASLLPLNLRYAAERIGVIVGTSHAGIQHIEKCFLHLRDKTNAPISKAAVMAASCDHTASVISQRLGICGPKSTVSSACASSNMAVGIAMDWLTHDQVDCVIVIGTDTISSAILAGFNALRAVSTKPSAPFSSPSGITLGEGAGALILERGAVTQAYKKEGAQKNEYASTNAHSRNLLSPLAAEHHSNGHDVQIKPCPQNFFNIEQTPSCERGHVQALAWVRGYGLSGDAYHETATDKEGRGVEMAMRCAMVDAGISEKDVDYISAHGTGTDANDVPESMAMERVFGLDIPLSSPKSFLGHTLGASGVIETIVTLLFAQMGLAPPTRNFKARRSGCAPLNYIENVPQPLNVRTFLCNNYGFGGNNASLVISRHPGPSAYRDSDDQIALVGYGAVGAFGTGTECLFSSLWENPGLVPWNEEWQVPAARAHKTVASLKNIPINQRSSIAIKAAAFAIKQALSGLENLAHKPHRCALICGVTHGALRHVEKFMTGIFDEGLQYGSATHFPLTTLNAAGGQASIAFGIKGFNATFCGAISALSYAYAIVRDGRQDRAVMFGSDELSPFVMRALSDIGLLANEAITPFSNVPGINPGEGAAALLIERYASARHRGAHIAAILSGFGLAQDGLLDALDPSGAGLIRAIEKALAMSAISSEDIDVIVSPGMGPRNFILAEAAALTAVFGIAIPMRVTAVAASGMAPSALFPLHILLAAEILRRQEAPPLPNTIRARPLSRARHILVLHCSASGEYGAVVVSAKECCS